MATKDTSLESLPIETLCRLVLFLPPQSVLNLVICCRKLHSSCDQFLAWRQSVRLNSGFPANLRIASKETSRLVWKQLAVADAKTNALEYKEKLLSWLPQTLAFHHQVSESLEPDKLHPLSDPTHYAPGMRVFECYMPVTPTRPVEYFQSDATSNIDIKAWRLAQAGSFCLAVHLLSPNSRTKEGAASTQWVTGTAPKLLETVPWTEIQATDSESQPAEYAKLVVILHTLANQAVGFFCARIWAFRHLREKWPNVWWNPSGTSLPPSYTTIPFPSLMNLPELFGLSSVEKFSLCHVPKMATPAFFEDGPWTGYDWAPFMLRDDGLDLISRDRLEGIGGDSETIEANHWNLPARTPGNPSAFCVERHATFKLVRWINPRFFIVESNCFQTPEHAHMLTLKVDSCTGMVFIIRHFDAIGRLPRPSMPTAVITPFGLVSMGSSPASYCMWLWKLNWSSN